ncbi:MAG: hypothetical protein ABI175_13395, partial [Polyangiales bacterium]
MDDAERLAGVVHAAVRVVEPAQRLHHDQQRELDREGDLGARATAQELVEVEAFDVLHRDEEPRRRVVAGRALGDRRAPQIEHLHDVGVREAGGELGLLHERFGEARVLRELA